MSPAKKRRATPNPLLHTTPSTESTATHDDAVDGDTNKSVKKSSKRRPLVEEAADHTVSPARLQAIYQRNHKRPEIIEAIARNPNTPVEILHGLPAQHAAAMMENPALPLHILVDSSFFDHFSDEIRTQIASFCAQPDVLTALFNSQEYAKNVFATGDSFLLTALAKNAYTPSSIIARLLGYEESEIRCFAAQHPACPADLLQYLSWLGVTKYEDDFPDPPTVLLEGDEDDESDEVEKNAIEREVVNIGVNTEPTEPTEPNNDADTPKPKNTPQLLTPEQSSSVVWDALLQCGPWVFAHIAQNPSTPSKILQRILEQCEDNPHNISVWLAQNPQCPPEMLQELLQQDDVDVQRAVVSNPHATTALLTSLLHSEDTNTRRALARHANADEAILSWLCYDEEKNIRGCVATNPITSASVLEILSHDVYAPIRKLVQKHANCPAESKLWIEQLDAMIRQIAPAA